MQTRFMINGRPISITDDSLKGAEIKRLGGIAADRNLVLQRTDGNYLVPSDAEIQVEDGDYFADAPTFEYGASR